MGFWPLKGYISDDFSLIQFDSWIINQSFAPFRIDVIFKTLHKALKDLAPIKPCFDKFSGEGKKLALQSEKALVKIVTDIMRKYEKDISKLRNGLRKVLTEARELFDKVSTCIIYPFRGPTNWNMKTNNWIKLQQVPAIVKCLKPGRKDSNACVKKELNTTFGGVLKVVTDLTTVIEIANNNLEPAKNEVSCTRWLLTEPSEL